MNSVHSGKTAVLSRGFALLTLFALFLAFSGITGPRSQGVNGGLRSAAVTPASELSKPATSKRISPSVDLARLPLTFEANKGQTDGQVRFLARGSRYTLFLTGDGAVLTLGEGKSKIEGQKSKPSKATLGNPAADSETSSVLRMKLLGAKPEVQVAGVEQLPAKSNYFIGNDPAKWRTNVPTYRKVAYRGVYPGVDLVYYGNQGELEYDFVVSPGADPQAIRLGFQTWGTKAGSARLRIDGSGDLKVKVGRSEVRFHKPLVYQWADDHGSAVNASAPSKTVIPARFVLRDGHEADIAVAAYDHRKPLIIDPILSYSSYLGGISGDQGSGIAVDSSGFVFLTGQTSSSNFPTQPGVWQPMIGGVKDAFVAKFDTTLPGTPSLIWSTYLGGSDVDIGAAIAVDGHGVYVTGQTLSLNFPKTPTAYQTSLAGNINAFVTKLKLDGSVLMYSTYLGGAGTDNGLGIAVDSGQIAYVAGSTNSTNFPITTGSYQTASAGGIDAFLSKIDTTLSGTPSLVYSTYIGGNGDDTANGIALDSSANAYITGSTFSNNFPTTLSTAFQPTFGGGTSCGGPCSDAFLTKIDTTKPGTAALIYSTYLGGTKSDQGSGIAAGSSGLAYVTGQSFSSDFPTSAGSLQQVLGGVEDAFVAKFDTTKSGSASLVYSTLLGGSGADEGDGIAVDLSGNAYVTGKTLSSDFPVASATQPSCGSCAALIPDAFLAKLNGSGTALIFSTFVGGSGSDFGSGVAVDSNGAILAVGSTDSTDFPTANAAQSTKGGGTDAFVVKISNVVLPAVSFSPRSVPFGNQRVGTPSAPPQMVTLTNAGDAPLTINASSGITITGANSGDFSQTNNCPVAPSSLAVGASCTINVVFNPTATGSRSANLSVADNASGSPQTVGLSGTGTQSGVSLSPTSLAFDNQPVGSTSPRQSVTVMNTGTASLNTTIITIIGPNAGDFGLPSNTCGMMVLPGSRCNIDVTFTPAATGARTATVSFTDDAPGSPHSFTVNGMGVPPAPVVNLSQTSLDFGAQAVGTTSGVRMVTLTNAGSAALSISGISPSGDFAVSHNCPASLPFASGSNSCTLNVTFTPTGGGTRNGTVTINDDASGSPHTISLTGTGADFSLVPPSPPSFTVGAGGSVTFPLLVQPANGFSQSVTLSCAGAPTAAQCTISPISVIPNGVTAASATVTVTTTARGIATPLRFDDHNPLSSFRWTGFALLLVLAALAGLSRRSTRSAAPRAWLVLGAMMLFGVLAASCGGGSSGGGGGGGGGTPAGNYTLTLTGNSGNVSHSTTVTLTVQ